MGKIKHSLLPVAVVITVLNEKAAIPQLVEAHLKQTKLPREIIIVDGGSSDGTWEELQKYKVKSFKKTGNRSMGRNFGVAQATSPIIAFTDAGCVPHPDWLEELIKPFSEKNTEVVSGYYTGVSKNLFQKCLIPYVLVMPDQIPNEFLPATRSMALRRTVWDESGGFDEALSHNEDFVFAHTLKKMGKNFHFCPTAIVEWEPRKNLKEAAWMFMRFAIGDAQAGIIRRKVKLLAMRYYLFFFLLFIHPGFVLLTLPYLIWAVVKNYRYVRHVGAFFWLPIFQVTADIMVLFGTIVGLLSRIK